MKIYSFNIRQEMVKNYFKPIRTKIDIIILLMLTIKHITIHDFEEGIKSFNSIVLIVGKMNRIFYILENSYHSISFPFEVDEVDGFLLFRDRYGFSIDSRLTSFVLSLFNNNDYFGFKFEELFYEFDDRCYDVDSYWRIVSMLMMYDDGYIRYDQDLDNENGDLHPLNHFDIFYTNKSTFKIGLRSPITIDQFYRFLNRNTVCSYLEKI